MKKRIILAGGGHSHLAVLDDWARNPLPGAECWLVTSSRYTAYSGMLPGWMARLYRPEELLIDLEPLAERAGARLVLTDIVGLNADARRLVLATGEAMPFDFLSLAVGGETDTSHLALAGARLMCVRPVTRFMEQWKNVLMDRCAFKDRPLAIVGGGAAGVELALAAEVSLGRVKRSTRIIVLTPERGFLEGHTDRVRQRVLSELTSRGIEVRFVQAVAEEDGLILSDGSHLAVGGIVAATGSRAPRWLAESGLACSDHGFVLVGADMRSLSHPAIFAAGDIVERADRRVARSGVHAVKAGPALAANLRASLNGAKLGQYVPNRRTLYLLATGDRRAILSWGHFSLSGRAAWRLKDWIDRRFVGRYVVRDTELVRKI